MIEPLLAPVVLESSGDGEALRVPAPVLAPAALVSSRCGEAPLERRPLRPDDAEVLRVKVTVGWAAVDAATV